MTIGIDLGTASSSIAFLDGEKPRVIPNRFGNLSTPSVLTYDPDRGIIVGEEALKSGVSRYDRTVSSFKRRMGSSFPCRLGDRIFTPVDLSALILQRLLKDAVRFLGQPVEAAILAVPAHFNENQRRATKEAAQKAGLSRVRLINEPTAAALAYGSEIVGRTAVFDFGGGTLDISLLEIDSREARVRCVGGDSKLGGVDFTRIVYANIKAQLRGRLSGMADARLMECAEELKIALSAATEAETGWTGDRISLSRSVFEREAAPLVARAERITLDTLKKAGWTPHEVDTVILAGGSSRIPAVAARISRLFSAAKIQRRSPGEIVALGAARAAQPADSRRSSYFEVLPYTLGLEIDGGRALQLVERNTPLPCSLRRTFTTLADNQTSVEIHVLQGSYLNADKNSSLGRFMLSGIRSAPKGVPQIEVDFTVDADGLLTVKAGDRESGVSERIVIPRITRSGSDKSRGAGHLRRLIDELQALNLRRGGLIDRELKEDIEDILAISAESLQKQDEERIRECIIALDTLASEVKALDHAREANRAG